MQTILKNAKKIVGATAIAAALGLSAGVVGDGVANAAAPAPVPTVQAPANPGVIQVQQIDRHGWGHDNWGWGPGWGR